MKKTFTGWIWKPDINDIGKPFKPLHKNENRLRMPTIYLNNDDYEESIKIKVTVETVEKNIWGTEEINLETVEK